MEVLARAIGSTEGNTEEESGIDSTTSNTLLGGNESYKVFPNPTIGIWNIIIPDDAGKSLIRIYDMMGKQMAYFEKVNSTEFSINASELNLQPRMFFLVIESEKGIYKKKLVYNH